MGIWKSENISAADNLSSAQVTALTAGSNADGQHKHAKLIPSADSATAIQITKADGTTPIINVDTTNSRVGIGTTTPDVALDVNGYTQLGTDAPKIKMKKLTGTTPAAEGEYTSIAHGLTATKIISYTTQVAYTSGCYVQAEYIYTPGFQFSSTSDTGNFYVKLHATNSENILSKPITVLVTYEE